MSKFVIQDMDEDLMNRLEKTAALNGISPEEEAKKILNSLLPQISSESKEKHLSRVKALREKNAHLQKTDSVDLIREDRDR